MMRATIYARQSKDRAEGITDQVARCRALIEGRGWELVCAPFTDNDVSASNGKPRPAYERCMTMVRNRQTDVVVVSVMDRLYRKVTELEGIIPVMEKARVSVAAVSGEYDLSTDSGRLVARILASVAQGEMETKSRRQRDAGAQAARNGKRRKGTPRPFGYAEDHVSPHPEEALAIEAACRMLLGGGTVSGITREWTKLGLRPPQAPFGPLVRNPWNRESVRAILTNPAIAGLSVYKGSVVGNGDWSPIVSEDTWRAVTGILNDPARKPPKGVRTLLGGLARCSCGNVIQGCPTTLHVPGYRCQPSTREDRSVTHVATAAAAVDEYVETAVIGILSKPDAVSLFVRESSTTDIAGLQERKLAIRTRLDQLAADYAAGIIERSALIAATERGRAEIAAADVELADAGRGNVYDGLIGAGDVQAVWVRLDSSRKRAVIDAMMRVTLSPVGRGRRALKVEDFVTLTPRT
jgi:site-specific DNA recombinase